MKPISTTSELHSIILGIMKAVRDFCDEHGIRYFLCGGTLLGAVREQGFIPWDDDADIGMLRPDFGRFCREFKSERYDLLTPETDRRTKFLFAKVVDKRTYVRFDGIESDRMGVFVDICPFDGVPKADFYPPSDSGLYRRFFWALQQKGEPLDLSSGSLRIAAEKLALLPLRALPNRFLTHALTFMASRHGTERSPFIGGIVMGYGLREILPRSVFSSGERVLFAGERFSSIAGWREYLSALYGPDFMTPPPPDKRMSHHPIHAFWRD